jgi:hypothetical protein
VNQSQSMLSKHEKKNSIHYNIKKLIAVYILCVASEVNPRGQTFSTTHHLGRFGPVHGSVMKRSWNKQVQD